MICNMKVDSKYLFFLASVVFLIGALATFFSFLNEKKAIENSILIRTNTIAQLLDVEKIKNLKGDDTDLYNPDYLDLKNRLQNTMQYNTDARFIYLMGQKDNQIFFFVDSEPDVSADYSPPGQVYDEASQELIDIFVYKKAIIEDIYTDRWGSWLTSLTPVIDTNTGTVLALVGMDINANGFIRNLLIHSSLPVVLSLLIIILIFIYYVLHKKEEERRAFKAELVLLASHEIRSPLNGVIWSLEDLIKNGSLSKDQQGFKTLQLIKESCDYLLVTVNSLLSLSLLDNQIAKKSWKNVELTFLINDLMKKFKLNLLEKEIILESDASFTNPVYVFGDEDKLKRMFANLISNAIKYSKEKSTIKVGYKTEGEYCIFWVKDTGIGIPVGEKNKILVVFIAQTMPEKKPNLVQGSVCTMWQKW